jgi:predicted transposase/invertase (TIGR01784 family)
MPISNDNSRLDDPLHKWLYFLKRAEHLESHELMDHLVDDEFREAVGVLEMISKSPEDRQFYEARMKFLHDEEARLIAARSEGREEGREEGIQKGVLAGKVQVLQQIVGQAETDLSDLLILSLADLTKLHEELQHALRDRRD